MSVNNIFDSHAHYDDDCYNDDRDELLNQMHSQSVATILDVGCTITAAEKAVMLAEQFPFVYASVGIHPEESLSVPTDYLTRLEALAAHDKVVAIGEIGLDYHYDITDRPSQKKILKEQLKLAERLNLPVVIHSRDAVQDTIEILSSTNNHGVIHCYSGSAETAKIYLDLGYYIGFT